MMMESSPHNKPGLLEEPFLMQEGALQLVGVLRRPPTCKAICILLPALTGTRVGPQRIFVSIARTMASHGLGSLCLDLPPNGDSFDLNHPGIKQWNDAEELAENYARYLDLILPELRRRTGIERFFLLSISWGCMPIVAYARKNDIEKAVLLSPSVISATAPSVNSKNLKSYYQKLFKKESWYKLFRMQLNFGRILRNIFPKGSRKPSSSKAQSPSQSPPPVASKVELLCIYGTRDPDVEKYKAYWRKILQAGKVAGMSEHLVSGADHSFFGWKWKENVAEKAATWLQQEGGVDDE